MKNLSVEHHIESREILVETEAHANIALVKYWGKRDQKKNLPAAGSVSLTLNTLRTRTELTVSPRYSSDKFILNGTILDGPELQKISRFANLICGTGKRMKLHGESDNNFPTGAGLASSASGYAALAAACKEAYSLSMNRRKLSQFARRGSGSAARSLYGGFVEMIAGKGTEENYDYASQLYDENYWDVKMVIAITSEDKKPVGSTEGMNRTALTSPFYRSWIHSSEKDIQEMKMAICDRDIEKAGELSEHSAFKMHGLAMSARPPVLYWNPATVEAIQAVWDLRKKGIQAYVTMDAGPQVKVFCEAASEKAVCDLLESVPGVIKVISAGPGPSVKVKKKIKLNLNGK